jgi:hypothetical protein
MGQDIRLSFDSLQNRYTKSIQITKFDLSNKKLTVTCSFAKGDLKYINLCKNNNIYIGCEKQYYSPLSESITQLNDSTNLMTLVFANYTDTLEQIDLLSDCDTCFYFKGIRLYRLYDVIVLEDGTVIKALVIEDGVWLIKYKKFGFEHEGVFTVPKNQVLCIRYRNPQIKKIKTDTNTVENNTSSPYDLIVMKNNKEIKSDILEVGTSEVKYKRANYIDGPVFSVLKKEVYYVKYKDGHTDTINYNVFSQVVQNQSNNQTKEDKTSNYGGSFSYGFCIGGGGLAGIPLRLYLDEQFVIEITIGARPMLNISSSTLDVETINFFYTGGLDLYFNKTYNEYKGTVNMYGIFIDGGGSTGNRYNEIFYSGGFAYEKFKTENQSFTFKIGAGLINMHDKKYIPASYYQPGKGVKAKDENLLIFWKFAWNFFL